MENIGIVVVGAGIAGLAAAQGLRKNGFTDVVVLEGSNRVGGRILSEKYGTGIIEIGAQWIHGEVHNPVFELALKHGLVHPMTGIEDGIHYFYLSDGSFISPALIRETEMVLDNVFNEANKFSREHISPNEDEKTVGVFVQNSFYKYLRTSNDTEETKRMKNGLFNWRLTMEKTENGCASIYDMSLGAWGEYVLCEGDEAVELDHGYQPVIDLILEDIPRTSINLNTHVEKIVWSENEEGCYSDERPHNRPVKVVTSDGRVFHANHVIVTSSLGYIKQHMDDLFLPRLPEDKTHAIQRLGYGTVNKIYLEFEVPFWEDNCWSIQLAWLPDEELDLDCLKDTYDNECSKQKSRWYKGIHGFDTLLQQPNLLCGWVAGSEAEEMENLSDDLVRDVCHELLQRFTGNKSIPKPTKVTRTKWFNDIYSVGSYSYRHTGSTVGDCDELARPLPSEKEPLLQFAGEATHSTYFSTTHGALLSGRREAERLATLYQAAVC